ncbi:hypothetical protein VB779_09555 [Haloarculaceae archaeon H-GB11]|nr:hypothetical protein [Haloarculaceae archaeon H-GB11]
MTAGYESESVPFCADLDERDVRYRDAQRRETPSSRSRRTTTDTVSRTTSSPPASSSPGTLSTRSPTS